MSTLSENILTIRGKLSQEEFGKIIDANKNKVYTYEKEDNPSTPKRHTLQRIAEYAGVNIDTLLNKKLKASDLKYETDSSSRTNEAPGIEERFAAINSQLRVVFLKIAELESRDPSDKSKIKSSTQATLDLEDLLRQATKRVTDELRRK